MKITIVILSLVAVLGTLYGLAFMGILPTQQWADKSPQMAHILSALHLAKSKHKPAAVVAQAAKPPAPETIPSAPVSPPAPDNGGVKESLPTPPELGAGGPAPPPPDTGAKLMAIYATMSPDDIARIWTKLPDGNVVADLVQLDEKKAGKVLAALPADRAARLSLLMSRKTVSPSDAPVRQARTSL